MNTSEGECDGTAYAPGFDGSRTDVRRYGLCAEAGRTNARGWALVAQGQSDEGIAQLRHGIAAVRATGLALTRPSFLVHLAEASGRTGQIEEGLNILAEALAAVHSTGERSKALRERFLLQQRFWLRASG